MIQLEFSQSCVKTTHEIQLKSSKSCVKTTRVIQLEFSQFFMKTRCVEKRIIRVRSYKAITIIIVREGSVKNNYN